MITSALCVYIVRQFGYRVFLPWIKISQPLGLKSTYTVVPHIYAIPNYAILAAMLFLIG